MRKITFSAVSTFFDFSLNRKKNSSFVTFGRFKIKLNQKKLLLAQYNISRIGHKKETDSRALQKIT